MIVRTKLGLNKVRESLQKSSRIAFDVETTGVNPMICELVGFSVGWDIEGQICSAYVPIRHKEPLEYITPYSTWLPTPKQRPDVWVWQIENGQVSVDDALEFLAWLTGVCEAPLLMHNARYEWIVLKQLGMEIPSSRIWDTMILASMYDPTRQHGLKDLLRDWLGKEMVDLQSLLAYKIGNRNASRTFDYLPIQQAAEYACKDVAHLIELWDYCWNRMDESTRQVYSQIEQPLVAVCARMQWLGVPIDRPFLEEYQNHLAEAMDAAIRVVKGMGLKYTGKEVWVNSGMQLSWLYSKMGVNLSDFGIPLVGREGSKFHSIAYEYLEIIVARTQGDAHLVASAVLEYKQRSKIMSSFVEPYLAYHIDSTTGRVHGTFDQRGTVTGRLSSYSPNMQQIPGMEVGGYSFRQAIVAPPGYLMVSIDYSQIEPRVLASLSNDPGLIHAFLDDQDVYKATAAALFNERIEDVTDEQRSIGKVCVLAAMYGSGPGNMVWQTGCSWSEANLYMDRFFTVYSQIRPFHERLMAEVRMNGYVSTMFGRRRFLDKNYPPYTVVVNTPVQGSAADLLKRAMYDLSIYCLSAGIDMVMSIHDEIVFLIKDSEVENVQNLVDIMENVDRGLLSVPLAVKVKIGKNWQEMVTMSAIHRPARMGLKVL